MRDVGSLAPYAGNARVHPQEQVEQIAASIRRFGFTIPMLVSEDGTIIAGHGRLMAAQLLGIAKVPVMVAKGWSEDDRRLYCLADNRLAETSEWDPDSLTIELREISEKFGEGDLADIGFSKSEIDALLPTFFEGPEGLTDPDDVPEAPARAVTVMGDTWVLGKHRLRCGDSTSADDVAALLAGVKPHLMVTDPPYGVVYDANWRNERVRSNGSPVAGRAIGKVLNDNRADWREAWALFPGDVAYVWCASLHNHEVAESIIASGFALRSLIIWAKGSFAISRSDYHWQHEPCWYAVRQGRKGHWSGDRKQTTLWQIAKPAKSETGHSTQKPVECMKRPIENNSSPGQAAYEPFSGSGTTIIAGEMTGRAIYAMELNPPYVDVAIKRWQDFTGQKAIHEATGEAFDDLMAKRLS